MPNVERSSEAREFLRQRISKFPEIMDASHNSWWRSTARLLIEFKRDIKTFPDTGVKEYLEPQVTGLIDELRTASHLNPTGENDFASLADHIIMNFSMEAASKFEKGFDIDTQFTPLTSMVKNQPGSFSLEDRFINGEECTILHVISPSKKYSQEIPLPKNRKVWHKGGPARAVLDIVAHAPLSMQESEFPWNDYDALVGEGRKNKQAAIDIGVEADGIEYMGENNLNFARYCAGRDTTQNQVCLGYEGLYYSSDALTTAITEHTRIENEYVANKAIYGFDKMKIQGENLAKPRGLMRLIKAVVEGKALSFDHIPLNSHFDLGSNTLFLAKRWSKKEQFPIYLQRLFSY